ncbi:hypothetical protein BKA70DRAFT_116798 [Coprinopsis sp. MPI-PUGE-AT-0042]|nr:hypothetical protein BKA70DRAFT_116798 [Coprinopsis sp. MPI-PUGE-AT-0042]
MAWRVGWWRCSRTGSVVQPCRLTFRSSCLRWWVPRGCIMRGRSSTARRCCLKRSGFSSREGWRYPNKEGWFNVLTAILKEACGRDDWPGKLSENVARKTIDVLKGPYFDVLAIDTPMNRTLRDQLNQQLAAPNETRKLFSSSGATIGHCPLHPPFQLQGLPSCSFLPTRAGNGWRDGSRSADLMQSRRPSKYAQSYPRLRQGNPFLIRGPEG